MSRNSLPAEIKDLGRKARSRLEEERAKRKEIVRIDATEHSRVQLAPVSLKQTRPASNPPPRFAKKRKHYHAPKNPPDSKKYDTWIPSITSITPIADDDRSNTVQLHGIPLETTAAAILRFFDGLDPVCIYLLLPNITSSSRLIGLDADYDSPVAQSRKETGRGQRTQVVVPRHDHSLRLLVKFHSAPVAKLATDRSKEGLQLKNDGFAAVAVTQLSKSVASCFSKNLAFEPWDANEPLLVSLQKMESKIDPLVINVLWEKTIRELDLKVRPGTKIETGSLYCRVAAGDPRKQTNHDKLSQHQIKLRSTYFKLINQLPFPSAELIDPCLSINPILRLQARAAECLQEEITRINDLLLQARRWKMFFK